MAQHAGQALGPQVDDVLGASVVDPERGMGAVAARADENDETPGHGEQTRLRDAPAADVNVRQRRVGGTLAQRTGSDSSALRVGGLQPAPGHGRAAASYSCCADPGRKANQYVKGYSSLIGNRLQKHGDQAYQGLQPNLEPEELPAARAFP